MVQIMYFFYFISFYVIYLDFLVHFPNMILYAVLLLPVYSYSAFISDISG